MTIFVKEYNMFTVLSASSCLLSSIMVIIQSKIINRDKINQLELCFESKC